MKRLIFAVVALVVLVAAASPSEVALLLDAQGFFVEAGSNADADSVEAAVHESMARSGDNAVAVIPEGPYVVPLYCPRSGPRSAAA